jgi:hypothetical protein
VTYGGGGIATVAGVGDDCSGHEILSPPKPSALVSKSCSAASAAVSPAVIRSAPGNVAHRHPSAAPKSWMHAPGVAVQVAFESKGLKPVFHFIGSRVETRRFQAMGRVN